MQSLEEAYDRRSTDRDPWRVAVGGGLGLAGALSVLAAVVLVAVVGRSLAARAWAGLLAGLGVPAMLLAVVVVLPANTRTRLGAGVGSLLTVGGVWLFWSAYPDRWLGAADAVVFETTLVYAAGGTVALAAVFSALATARRRNDPAGTVTMSVTRDGGTETVEVSRREYRRVREAVGDGGEREVLEDLLEE